MNTYTHKVLMILFIAGIAFSGHHAMGMNTEKPLYKHVGMYYLYNIPGYTGLRIYKNNCKSTYIEIEIDGTTLSRTTLIMETPKTNLLKPIEYGTIHRSTTDLTEYLLTSQDQRTQKRVKIDVEHDDIFEANLGYAPAQISNCDNVQPVISNDDIVNHHKQWNECYRESLWESFDCDISKQYQYIGLYSIYQAENNQKVLRLYPVINEHCFEYDIEKDKIIANNKLFSHVDNKSVIIEKGTVHTKRLEHYNECLLVSTDNQLYKDIRFDENNIENSSGNYTERLFKPDKTTLKAILKPFVMTLPLQQEDKIIESDDKHNPLHIITAHPVFTITGVATCAALLYVAKKYFSPKDSDHTEDEQAQEQNDISQQ